MMFINQLDVDLGEMGAELFFSGFISTWLICGHKAELVRVNLGFINFEVTEGYEFCI